MTRKEAFEKSREGWKTEEKQFATSGAYAFDTATAKWLANVNEAQSLTLAIKSAAGNLADELYNDAKTLEHYSFARRSEIRDSMATDDPDGAVAAVQLLANALETLKGLVARAKGE